MKRHTYLNELLGYDCMAFAQLTYRESLRDIECGLLEALTPALRFDTV